VAFVEVKLHAGNDLLNAIAAAKFNKYIANTQAFSDPTATKASGLYELARNWRIGWDLAEQRPFRLVNLGPSTLFEKAPTLTAFEGSLAFSDRRRFIRLTWSSLLRSIAMELGTLPMWLKDWFHERGFAYRAMDNF
jgi:hypothetical protein